MRALPYRQSWVRKLLFCFSLVVRALRDPKSHSPVGNCIKPPPSDIILAQNMHRAAKSIVFTDTVPQSCDTG
jgi:hypothetical protein